MHKSLIYLAVPYSDPNPEVQNERFHKVNKVAAALMGAGLYVFSPISHTHPIAEAGDLPRDWRYWEGYDYAILSGCGCLAVLMLEGWRKSVGVSGELGIADALELPTVYLPPNEPVANMVEVIRNALEGYTKLP